MSRGENVDALTQRRQPAPIENLNLISPRELEVVRLIAFGLQNKEIGRLLGITSSSVNLHVFRIYNKLSLSTRVELCLWLHHAEGPALFWKRQKPIADRAAKL